MKGIKFNEVHSYRDLNLVAAPFEIAPAKAKTNYLEIEGADGSLDLTEAHGEVKFSDREGSLTFYALPGDDWEAKKTEVSNFLNGLQCKMTLDKDPNYYYFGRFTVNDYKSDKMLRQIVIDYRLKPYKYKKNITTKTLPSGTHNIVCDRMPVIPEITTTASTTFTFKGGSYTVGAGTNQLLNIRFTEGNNQITISTSGSVTFKYQEGAL